ncbi:MAG TPA: Bax inhibitor-1/YccA family protein [Steroidobacteraceae bacterium]|nr:Bax inhibitor-1/YccA family protein [Steroidobacteraceae bacterium]
MPLNERPGSQRGPASFVFNQRAFSNQPRLAFGEQAMTVQGTVNKSFLLLVVLLAGAFWTWSQYLTTNNPAAVALPMMAGFIGGLALYLAILFRPTLATYLSIPYAACEGLLLGGISAQLERRYPGIAIQAVGLTFAVLAAMLFAYKVGLIRVTQRFRMIVLGGLGAIMLLLLVSFVLNLFHVATPFLFNSTPLSLGISLLVIGFTAFSLALNFDAIEAGVSMGVPRFMEWYSAFGLLVTLVTLYLWILQFLAQSQRR